MGQWIVKQTGVGYVQGGGTILAINNAFPGVVMAPLRGAPVEILERNPVTGPISLREVCEDDRGQIVREYMTAWDTRDQAKKWLLGYPYVSPKNGTRYIQRFLPDYIPWLLTDNNGFEQPNPYLWCTSLPSVEPDGVPPSDNATTGNWGECRYTNAFITALYTTPTYELLTDAQMVQLGYVDGSGNPDESTLKRYVTILPNPQQKYQSLPTGSFYIAANSGGTPVIGAAGVYPGSPGRVELEADLSITWHRVPKYAIPFKMVNPFCASTVSGGAIYIPAVDDCLGAVNHASFAGMKKGTLLFSAAVFKPIRSPIGMRLWDVEYRFKYFAARSANKLTAAGVTDYQYGHNLVLYYGSGTNTNPQTYADPAGYYEIVKGQSTGTPTSNYLLADGTPTYDYKNLFNYRDFTNLFRVPQLTVDPGNG
jgi:hypothetical protein